uniref:Cytochrome b n=1 Tax=Stenostomum leucops TaxID=52061 RepID=A0A1U9IVZ7_9PLAT|nr:cytochrome b [Stenostomum leucops]
MYNLKSPSNLNFMWNFGSMLGLCLAFQIVSGLFLSFHYAPTADAFLNVDFIMREVNEGWFMRFAHANGASMFFLLMYIHIFRGLFFKSYKLKKVWLVGNIIFLLAILTAFLGYVLPWGQMSFWAATVITNLVSAVPVIGKTLVEWLWGGFSVSTVTLNRFYSFHFLFPFILLVLVIMHLLFLHLSLSSNPLGIKKSMDYADFHQYFTSKDFFGLMIMFMMWMFFTFFFPNLFIDPENYMSSNPMSTPAHIKPEWYFLPFYAVLRSVPNKLGGVILMVMMIVLLGALSFMRNSETKVHFMFMSSHKIMLSILLSLLFLLFWIGASPVVYPFDSLGKLLVLSYFLLFIASFFNLKGYSK